MFHLLARELRSFEEAFGTLWRDSIKHFGEGRERGTNRETKSQIRRSQASRKSIPQ